MSAFSHYPLQKSVYETLSGDSALMALVSGVFDRPPQGTEFPYITLGEASGNDWSAAGVNGMQYLLALQIWSREGGRKQAALIRERVYTLLHQADLSVEGQTLVLLRFVSSAIALLDDGYTYHGAMGFQALLRAED
jgi:hypothetical protein